MLTTSLFETAIDCVVLTAACRATPCGGLYVGEAVGAAVCTVGVGADAGDVVGASVGADDVGASVGADDVGASVGTNGWSGVEQGRARSEVR